MPTMAKPDRMLFTVKNFLESHKIPRSGGLARSCDQLNTLSLLPQRQCSLNLAWRCVTVMGFHASSHRTL